MLINFFLTIRRYKVPATIRELMDLIKVLEQRLVYASMDDFYMLSRACLVKDEKHYDKFDRAFDAYFKGLEDLHGILVTLIQDEWLRNDFVNSLSPQDYEELQSLGELEKLIEAYQEAQKQQQLNNNAEANKLSSGKDAQGEQEGEGQSGPKGKGRSARKQTKSWQSRQYRRLDDSVEIGTRNIKVALRRLRKLARTGKQEELDIETTIRSTADNGGLIDIQMRSERKNVVKVLLFLDIGGSMDAHVRQCEKLFSATKTEFKYIENFYFHNFIYDSVWKDDKRYTSERVSTVEVLRKYLADYKVIFVGDATMAPYEITHIGGSLEHWNAEPGAVWMKRICLAYNKVIWLNPTPMDSWDYSKSIAITRQMLNNKMFPLTLAGIEQAMIYLAK